MTGVQTCALRSEEHTSELQSHDNLVCRLLLEKNRRDRTSFFRTLRAVPLLPPLCDPAAPPACGVGGCHGSVARRRREETSACSFFFLNNRPPPGSSPLPLTGAFRT